MTDKKLRKCPKCGKFQLHRLIGMGTGIIFKGTGFYETDYKKKAASAKAEREAPCSGCPASKECDVKPNEDKGKNGK